MIITYILYFIIIYLILSIIYKNYWIVHPDEPKSIGFALPLIGHLHLIGRLPHKGLLELVRKHGKVFKVWMGDYYSIVICDPQLIRQILVHQPDAFPNKHRNSILKLFSSDYNNLIHGRDDNWLRIRKAVASSFSQHQLRQSNKLVESELSCFIHELFQIEKFNQSFDPELYFRTFSMNIILGYVFSLNIPYGQRLQDQRIKGIIENTNRLMVLMAKPYRLINGLGYLYFQYVKWFDNPLTNVKSLVQEIYVEHLKTIDPNNPRDLFDHLILTLGNDDPLNVVRINHVAIDMILAGSETTSSTMEWILLYLINYPEYQEKIFNEINQLKYQNNNQNNHLITLEYRNSTPFLNSFIKECMRLKWIVPVAVARECKQDVMIDKYFIPKGTQTYQFPYSMMMLDEYWDDPTQFKPDRFLHNNHQNHFIPFGIGPRNCIGMNLALDELYLVITNMIFNFKLYSLNNEKLDDVELMTFVSRPKKYLVRFEKRDNNNNTTTNYKLNKSQLN